jgi:hypothetical protein
LGRAGGSGAQVFALGAYGELDKDERNEVKGLVGANQATMLLIGVQVSPRWAARRPAHPSTLSFVFREFSLRKQG